jgi:hypothetical protein
MATAVQCLARLPFAAFAVNYTEGYHMPRDDPLDGLRVFGVHRSLRAVGVTQTTLQTLPTVHFNGQDAAATDVGKNDVLPHGVVSLGHQRTAAYVVATAVCCTAVVIAFVNTAPWCGRHVVVYELQLLIAIVVDIVVVQPCTVLLVWLWRWMTADGAIDLEVHPVPGGVLPWWDTLDDVEDGP